MDSSRHNYSHISLGDLRQSSEDGCQLFRMVWDGLDRAWCTKYLQDLQSHIQCEFYGIYENSFHYDRESEDEDADWTDEGSEDIDGQGVDDAKTPDDGDGWAKSDVSQDEEHHMEVDNDETDSQHEYRTREKRTRDCSNRRRPKSATPS